MRPWIRILVQVVQSKDLWCPYMSTTHFSGRDQTSQERSHNQPHPSPVLLFATQHTCAVETLVSDTQISNQERSRSRMLRREMMLPCAVHGSLVQWLARRTLNPVTQVRVSESGRCPALFWLYPWARYFSETLLQAYTVRTSS